MTQPPHKMHPTSTEVRRPTLDEQMDQYRAKRRRRQTNISRRHGQQRSEKDEVLHVALIWAPYGGPPPEVIFERFGITLRNFTERVQEALQTSEANAPMAEHLRAVYEKRPGHKP